MSTLDRTAAPAEVHPADARVSFAGAVAAEWVKFRTLRSTLAVLGAAMLGMLVIGVVVGINTRHLSSDLQPDDIVQILDAAGATTSPSCSSARWECCSCPASTGRE